MSNLRSLVVGLLFVACPLYGQLDIPQMAGDVYDCTAGTPGKVWANTSTGKIRKCEDGVISDMDSSVAATGTNGGPKGDEYDPDRAPTSGLYAPCSDEFNPNVGITGTWTTFGSLTITDPSPADYRKAVDASNATEQMGGFYCTPDNSADWTFTIKLSITAFTSINHTTAGIFAVDGGTGASPTRVNVLEMYVVGTVADPNVMYSTVTGYTFSHPSNAGTNKEAGATGGIFGNTLAHDVCLQLRYVVSSKVMTAAWASDCRNFGFFGASAATKTLTNAPAAVGFEMSNISVAGTALIQWIRFRNDSAGTTAPYLVGE